MVTKSKNNQTSGNHLGVIKKIYNKNQSFFSNNLKNKQTFIIISTRGGPEPNSKWYEILLKNTINIFSFMNCSRKSHFLTWKLFKIISYFLLKISYPCHVEISWDCLVINSEENETSGHWKTDKKIISFLNDLKKTEILF